MTDPAKPIGAAEEKLIAALVDAIWEDRYGGVSRDWATAEARALLAAYTAKVREEERTALMAVVRRVSEIAFRAQNRMPEEMNAELRLIVSVTEPWLFGPAIRARGGEETRP